MIIFSSSLSLPPRPGAPPVTPPVLSSSDPFVKFKAGCRATQGLVRADAHVKSNEGGLKRRERGRVGSLQEITRKMKKKAKQKKNLLCQEVNATPDLCESGTRDGAISQFEFHTWCVRSSRSGVMEHLGGGGGWDSAVARCMKEAVTADRRREREGKQPPRLGGWR